MQIDEKEFMRQTAVVMSDDQPLPIIIQIKQLWIVISAIQLATRHPGLHSPLKAALEEVGRQMQAAIVDRHPEAGQLIEMGWHEENDYVGGDDLGDDDDDDDSDGDLVDEYDDDYIPF